MIGDPRRIQIKYHFTAYYLGNILQKNVVDSYRFFTFTGEKVECIRIAHHRISASSCNRINPIATSIVDTSIVIGCIAIDEAIAGDEIVLRSGSGPDEGIGNIEVPTKNDWVTPWDEPFHCLDEINKGFRLLKALQRVTISTEMRIVHIYIPIARHINSGHHGFSFQRYLYALEDLFGFKGEGRGHGEKNVMEAQNGVAHRQ